MELLTTFGILIVTLVILAIYWLKSCFNYWQDLGIHTTPHKLLCGHIKDVLNQKETFSQVVTRSYNEMKKEGHRYSGIYLLWSPVFIPIDVEIIKSIMQSDFQHFVDRGFYVNSEVDPLSVHLFNLSGNKWKLLRSKLTPTFTSGKMKMMFDILVHCSKGLERLMEKEIKSTIDVKQVLSRFTIDVIGSCAFGIETNALENENSEFLVNGKRLFKQTRGEALKRLLLLVMPSIMRMFKMKVNSDDVINFFMGVVKSTVNHREKNDVTRKDFMHLLIQLKNRGQLVDDNKLTSANLTIGENTITIEEIAAQAFIFFEAGFETSSGTMGFCLFELGQNKDIQKKVREEILEVLKKHNGNLTYDSIAEMEYLDKCVSETLRKYPTVPAIPRICTKNYKIPETDITIVEETRAFIPVYALHHDPAFYPDPEKFDPERFTEENKRNRPAFSYIPFGEGPRICIGMRFGLMQTKVGLITILRHYDVTTNEKSFPAEFDTQSLSLSLKRSVWIDCETIQS